MASPSFGRSGAASDSRSYLRTCHIATNNHAMQRYLTVRNSRQLGALRERLFANRTNCRV